MREIGIVTRIEGDRVLVECKPSSACHSCKGELCAVKNRSIPVQNIHHLPVQVGDRVEISVPSTQALSAGFQVFGIPLFLFIVFYLSARYIVPHVSEGTQIGWGMLGLGLGFLGMFFWGRKSARLPILEKRWEGSFPEDSLEEVPEH
ncbi:MAG: SoxR reducing system RseC family protein [Spirochaetes bacterium]|nr:SoxR reducing system RseC family protein [Spirochaetota bacterium]